MAAEHAAVWGYGVVGAALDAGARGQATVSETAHRDVRDRIIELLDERSADPVAAEGAYALPSPVLSPTDAAALAVVLEDGVAIGALTAAEVRAVGWRLAAGQSPVTIAFPGLPKQ